jgi:hypothetical protein
VRKVLPGITDDSQPIGRRVEIDAEEGPRQRDRQRIHERRLRRRRVDRVDATAVADTVQLSVLNPEVDTDKRGIGPRETCNKADVSRSARGVRSEPHEPAVVGQSDDPQVAPLVSVRRVIPREHHADCRQRRECLCTSAEYVAHTNSPGCSSR